MEKLNPKGIENILSLTPLQEGMLFHHLKDARSGLYFEQLSLGISGEIDPILFEKAWNIVTKTNEMLRTVFRWEKVEKPSQIILKEHPCRVIFYDLSGIKNERSETVLQELKKQDLNEGFDLQEVPFRVTLCKLTGKNFVMIISSHHILYDGWSNGIILREFFKNYELCRNGKSVKIPLKTPFKEFVKWIQSQDKSKQKKFWHDYLAGIETITEIPIKNNKEKSANVREYSFVLPKDICRQLDAFSKEHRVTLAAVFYATWGLLLQRYCSSEDIVFGTTISGRSASIKQIENMVGIFINTLPLRVQSTPTAKLIDVIAAVENHLQEREAVESTPLLETGAGSLFDTIMVIENYPLDNRLLPPDSSLSIQSYAMAESTHYDLTVGIMMFDQIEIKFSFREASFAPETIENIAEHIKNILQTMSENPGLSLSSFEIITPAEKNRLLYEFNNTAADYPIAKTLPQLFAEQESRTPDHIALVGADLRVCPVFLTYRQLNEQSNRMVDLLIDKGVLPDMIVAIMMERSVEMIVGIMGILKSGGAYLPIDPSYPQERIDYMLKDSKSKILISKSEVPSTKFETNPDDKNKNDQNKNIADLMVLNFENSGLRISNLSSLKECPHRGLHHSNLAYIIYTSGSTGRPKGVMIEHRSVVNLLFAMQNKYPFTPSDTYLLKTSYTFDVSVTELFGWFMGGGKLAILEKNSEKDPLIILNWIQWQHITHINFVPSMFNSFLDFVTEKNKSQLRSLKYIFLAGEASMPALVKKFRDLETDIELENIYGPTEGTVYSSRYSLAEWNGRENVPIGKSLPNIKLYILNKYNHLQPLGVPGELYISGDGVARGYLNNPALTAEKFRPLMSLMSLMKNKNSALRANFHAVLYRTGDLCQWLSNGNIEFLGRIDQQIKIRGFRVELGEIENRLLKHEQVKDAVVLAKEDAAGDKYLAAYFVSEIEIPGKNLIEYLAKDLPEYMIPSYVMRLGKIPLTPSGKVDRKALPESELKSTEIFAAPRSEIEKKLVEIWGKVLGKDISLNPIGIDDHFFRLGGHSLKATSLVSLLYKTFNVKIPLSEIFKRPTIRQLSDHINNAVKEQYVSIEPVEKKEYYMLSSAQKRLYFLQQMDNAGTTYNISASWVLDGEFDYPKLENTFIQLVQRHESFRTSFAIIAEEPAQRIQGEVEFEIEYLASDEHRRTRLPGAGSLLKFIRPFDLSQAPLMRVGLVSMEAGRHLLMVDMHHIISDGISAEILVREFTALYSGEEPPIVRLQYKDYAEWQRRLKQEEYFLRQKSYWKKEFEGQIPVLEMPGDYARPPVQSFEGNRITFTLGSETVETVNTFALDTGTTLYMVLLASYSIFLAKLSGREDIIIGTPVAGRRYADFEKIIGVFVNTLVLRMYPAGEKSFNEFLEEIKERTLEAFENQDYQYEDLVECLAIGRDAGRNPLFDVMFVLQNMGNGEIEIPGLKLTPYDLENKTSKFDLILTVLEIKGKLEFTFEYCTKLFKQETIERFITYYKNVLFQTIFEKDQRLADLEMLPGEEKNRLLYEFNDTEAEYPQDKTIHHLFVEKASKMPGHIAVFGHGRTRTNIHITYLQLNEQSNQLAGLLIEKGVVSDTIVGIMMERTIEMIIGIFGILKSGGAYMPIDPGYPQQRIHYMLKDSGAKLLAVANDQEGTKVRRGEEEKIFLESIIYDSNYLKECPRRGLHHSSFDIPRIHHTNHLAYIIYTSGTTGQPKGSLIEHRNVVRLLFNDKFQFDFNDRDIWTLFHSICFDFSVWEMYGALLYGGKSVIVPKMTARDTRGFLGLLVREAVTVLNQTPSAFYNLINEALNPRQQGKELYIKYVIFGGEALGPLKLKDWLEKYPHTRLINMFGITETTVHVTYKEITKAEIELSASNIGKPIPTLSIYILDPYLKPVPLGVPGEICVSGKGVCRGYLSRVELTEEKFIGNPYKRGDRLYRSGDVGRFLVTGDIEYLGRIDHQVKIRGFRIELGEIENRLLHYDGIKDVVVLAEGAEAEKYLCAYIVPHKEFTITELRAHLAAKLPDYMIPAYFARLGKIPLTPNGKIDRKALPDIHNSDGLWEEAASPTTETEEKLAGLWETVLGPGKQAGINADFFHSGGDSIKAVGLINAINTGLSTNLKIADIYIHGTIKKLASLIDIIDRDKIQHVYTAEELEIALTEIDTLKNRLMDILEFPAGIEDVYPMSDIQEGMVYHSLKEKEAALYHDQMVYQPVIKNFKPEILKKAFILMAAKHPILRTVFDLNTYEVPVQLIYRQTPYDIVHEDISHMDKGEQEAYLVRFLAEDRKKVFPLDSPPLWRLRTFDLGGDNICVVLVAHHAILDGWSVASLDTELLNTYWQLSADPTFRPGILKNTYKAFIIEQAVEKKRVDAADFWRNELDDYKRLELPKLMHPNEGGNKVQRYRHDLGKDLFSKLKATAKIHHTTLKNLCFSAYIYMLNMLSYENEIVTGLVTNNRPLCDDGDKILGCFLNTIPVRIIIPAHISWSNYVKLVDKKLLELKKYERMPFFEIVRMMGENAQNGNPIFDVLFNYIDFHVLEQIQQDYGKNRAGKLQVEEKVTTNTAFDFNVSTTLGNFELIISYSESFFNPKMVGDLCCYFEGVLDKFIAEPGEIANKIELLPVEEKKRLLDEFNDTSIDYPKDKTIHELFVEQVEKTPDFIAIVGNADVKERKRRREEEKNGLQIQITYRQLNEKSGRLAGLLIEKGVLPDTIVGIMMERSVEMIIGIMAILKAGSAYLPIDPGYPQERIQYMLADCNAKILFNKSEARISKHETNPNDQKINVQNQNNQFKNVMILDFKNLDFEFVTSFESRVSNFDPLNLAYLIYTSGSTGKPKGVVIEHRSVVNLLFAMQNQYPLFPSDTYLLKTSYTFDVSVTELFGWFMGGGKLAILKTNGEKDPQVILDCIQRHYATYINFVPSMFNAFLGYLTGENKQRLACLKYIFLAGEAILPGLVTKFKGLNIGITLENLYGPTEGTIYSSQYSLSEWNGIDNVPIGKPLANIKLYILNKYNHLQPLGIPGELYIGGNGVARGYLNNPELTAGKFIFSPNFLASSFPNFLLYRTGDLARWLPHSNIEFLGRRDSQVKIRGFRIELGEIENRLLKHKHIKEAVVLVNENEGKDKNLIAYIVSSSELLETKLREYLREELPDYMLPSHFVPLEKIPLTPNGKLDRKALPKPELKAGDSYIAPRNEIEKKLVEIWSDVLSRDELHAMQVKTSIGIDDNFFHLGGHSLKATVLVSKIHKEFQVNVPLSEIFKTPTIRGEANYIKSAMKDKYISIEPVEKKEYYSLSSAQKRLYILHQMDRQRVSYNIPFFSVFAGEIDKDKLQSIFKQSINRHESLRTSFHMINNEPVQRIHDEAEFEIKYKDLAANKHGQTRPQSVGNLLNFIQPFDLSQAPLLRVVLAKEKENHYILLVDMHHIIADGTSINILIKDFMALYQGNDLPGLRVQYKDFSTWQNHEKHKESIKRQMDFWENEFAGEIPVLELPGDFPRPAVQSFEGSCIHFEIDKETAGVLKKLALEMDVTIYMILLAFYTMFLYRLTNQEDIVVGCPIAGRRHADTEKIIGMFVNTMALRNYPSGDKIFTRYLHEIKEKTLRAFENQDCQYEDLVEQVVKNRDVGRNPLFDTVFVLQNMDITEINITDLKLSPYPYENKTAKFDLTLSGIEEEGKLSFTFEYCSKLFREKTIERFIDYFKNLVNDFIENKNRKRICDFEILTEEEKKLILFDFNDTETDYPGDKTIHQLFAEQVERVPDRIAVAYINTIITYRQLNEQANRLAGLLLEKGVQPDTIVGIMMERSIEMIISIIGILKAGGAYLPIDPDYPKERIKYMLQDSNAGIIVNSQFLMNAPQAPFHQHSAFSIHHSNHLAYVIYTSGSTGKAKSVMVEHRNVARLVKNTTYIKLNPRDRILPTGALAFDASTFEIWGGILNGLTLYLVSNEIILNAEKLKKTTRKYQVTIMWMTSPLFNQTLEIDIEAFAGLRTILVGGDKLSVAHINRLKNRYPHLDIINGYGPTENTTFSTTFLIDREYSENIPIGKPIANSTAYIVDIYNRLQPIGVPGELLVGGDGIARGYMNNPELTAERFYRSYWFYKSYINYKTGDIAKWLSDGNIEFLGRIDHQVKIRGFRIELGEIENQLMKYPGVKEALVLAQEERGDKYLCAYIVSDGKDEISRYREYLSLKLPVYMIPSYFIPLEKIPLTPNGKIDRKVLQIQEVQAGKNYRAPGNKIEMKLVELWSTILGREELHAVELQKSIGIDENFFHLGGHSLKATILASKIHKELNVHVPLAEIFKRSTIRELAKYISNKVEEKFEAIPLIEKKDYYELSSAQKRLFFLHQLDRQEIGYNIPCFMLLEGKIDKDRFEHTFRQLINRHESLRTSFHIIKDEPVQRIHDEVEFEIRYLAMDTPSQHRQTQTFLLNFIRPFDLSQAPLLRVGLLEEKEERHLLMVDIHHIVSDGTSMNIVVKDFMSLYQVKELPALRLQYKDFSGWQNSEKHGESLKRQGEYWLDEFEEEIPVLELPIDYPRPTFLSFEGSNINFEIDRKTTEMLNKIALETDATTYMILLTVYVIFLAKITNQEDIVVGSPIAGRRHEDLGKIIGMFVNTLALRNFPLGEKTFIGFLHEVKTKTLNAFENQDYQFEYLVDLIVTNRDTSRNPVFEVMFVLQNMGIPEIQIPGLILKPYHYENKTAKFDLNLVGLEKDGKLIFNLEYSTKLFKEKTILRFRDYFKNLINTICENPEARISAIGIMNKEEKESILELCCSAVEPEVVGETVYEIFEEITIGHKDKIALVFRDGRLTYGELNQRADVLSRMLQDNGIGRDSVVGLMIERSFPLVIGILGIMKAGGAYLPIDPKLPQERIDYMLEDSNAAILLIKKEQEIIDNCQLSIVNRKQMSLPQVHFHYSKQLVYIIYTSGSTGKPKGVMLDHGNLVNLVCFHYKYTNIDFSKVLQFTTISFDVSFQEIFSTLLHGGELYLIDEETRVNIILLLEFIRKNKIKTLFLPMSFLRLIFEEEYTSTFPTSVAHIITAGEKAIVNDSFRNCLKENNIHFHNHYGPSETHVITTFTMNPQEDIPGFPPIGKPVQNTVIYILDKAQQLLPIGVAGELYACGLQVGRGYLNNPELTAEKFIFSPNSLTSPFPNFLLYRTGDQARWQINGNIEFLGRIDQQVKIHGIRVEPGEIEHQLQKIDIIKDAVIAVKQDKRGEKYLCAYIVLNTDTALNESGLKNILSVNLPDYMVPSYFVQMDKIPLTPSGKIDKKALPGPEFKIAESYIAPGNELEKKLVILWAEVLGKDELHSSQLLASIGISDNFFQLGGHSLKAVILISKIHKELKIKVPLAEIFKAPSIMGLAEFIKRTGESGFFSIVGAEKKEYYALASAQKRIYILQQMDKDGTAYNIPVLWLMEGLLNMDKLKNAIDRLIQRHESLRTSFVLVGEKTVQKIHEHVDFEIEYENCNSSIDYPDYKEEKDNKRHHSPFSTHNFIRAFDLSKPPLLRVGLIKLAEDKHIFLVDMHHIISDGMSSHVLAQDFSAFYAGAELPQIMFQYKDYAEWQNREKVSKKVLEQGEYWKKEFTGEIPMLDLPTDYARPVAQAFEGSSINFELNSEISNALKALALEAGATLYIVLLALYTSFLSKLCGQEDIVIGSPVAGRQHADLEKIIGMFVNTLVLRNYPIGEKTFKEYLLEVKEKTLSAFENQEYPYEDLVDQVVMNRDVSRNPLFDVMFALQNTGSQKIEIPGLKLVPYEYDLKTTKVDLALTVVEVEEKLLLIFRYSTKLFKNKTIERLIGYFKNVITHIISKPCVKMSEVEIIPEETRQAILNHFNENLSGVSELKPIQIILSDIFQKYRENTAIDYGATCITYAELEHRAACISQWIKDRNILAGSFMGIYIENKINIISSIIGILQRACIFVPMDTNLPRKRLENMIRLTNMQVILTDAGHEILLSGIKDMAGNSPNNFVIDDSFYRSCKPDRNKNANSKYDLGDKIYVYFTSGSTGIPNAIVGKNKSLVQFIQWEIETFAVNENYRISQLTSVGFDAFLRDVFVPFFAGGTICIPADKEILIDRNTLIDWLESKRINLVHCVPSLFHIILSVKLTPSLFPGLKNILLSGEPINPNELRGWYQVFGERIQLVNYYGPTETTMIKTFHHITMGDIEAGTVPAGRPIIGTRIIILDKYMKICDQGIIGEIYVRTAYGTHGYLDNPGLNAQRFIQNPFGAAEGDLVYKTGDLGRLLENGEILVLGRIDRQIKIRGVRIELENIENCLLEHGKIERAIVICRKDGAGENYLCAYIVFKKQQTTGGARQDEDDIPHTPELREFLAGELPDYMIPSYFVQIENIPLTANGKIDRKALPKPGLIAGESYIAPKGEIEKKLVELWAGILCRDEAHASQLKTSIGIDDNFFQLGGHSLKATILVSGIHKGLNVQVPLVEIFKRPTVRGLAEYIKGKVEEKYQSIEPVEKKEYYELSSAQKRLFFLRQLDPDGVAYNIPVIIPLPGDFQLEKLDDIFKELIKRHDNLRTSFHLLNSGPVQKIHDEVKFEIEYFATDTLPQNRQTQTLTEVFGSIFFQKGGFIRPFDLLRAPLMRAGLVKNSDGSYVLLVDIHHIITDGTSQEVLKHDFMSLYRGEPLPSLRLQYKDFAQWQNSNKENDRIKRQELYWLKEFPGEIPVLSIPTDYPRPLMQSFAGNKINFEIPAAETGLLHDLALRIGATLFMVLAAVLNILLAKLSGQEDIVIGTPVAGRRHADLEKIIGIFVNTLALRNYPVGENTFPGFLDLLKNRTLEAFENQEYPFDDLVEKVSISRDMGRNPLFDVLFVLQNIIDVPAEAVFEKRMVEDENITRTVKFDLEITAWEAGQELKFVFGYGTKLFKKETIEQCITYFKRIVSIVVKDLGIRIKDINLISEEEKKQILSGFNDTAAEYPEDKTIHRLFAEQASKTPGHIALVGAGSQTCPARNDCPVWITYRQLDKQSDDLAGLLIEKGVQTDSIVAIMMERSVEMVIAIFGILKSSGAYLPIDPEYPQERIEYMLKDSGTKILLTNDEKKKDNCQCSIVNCQLSMRVDSQEFHHSSFELPRVHHSNHLCYIIYTSGSTGNPKGVMIEHAAVHNFIEGMIRCIDFKPGKKILALTTISFDIFGLEILLPLCKGLMVVIANEEHQRDIQLLKQLILKSGVEMLQATPSRMQMLIENEGENSSLRNLTEIMVGGEALPGKLNADLAKLTTANMYNMYGPTETTIWSTVKKLNGTKNITVGKPIINTQVYILSKYLQLQPVGIPGEMYISGNGVAIGYLNRPELTAEKFQFNRSYGSYKSNILYKTGDLARWLPNGDIEFLGRMDYQVKVKGFRIELEEIEKNLKLHENIKDAVVITNGEATEQYLCAYIVSTVELRVTELREYLARKLPGYMIPSSFIKIDKIPVNLSGKVDRNVLRNYRGGRLGSDAIFVEPSTDIEKTLAALWKEVLKLEKISIYDNFFELGGNSLKVVQLNDKLREVFKIDIPVAVMFRYLNIYSFTKYLNENSNPASEQIKKSGHLENLKQSARTYKDTVKRFKKGEKNERK